MKKKSLLVIALCVVMLFSTVSVFAADSKVTFYAENATGRTIANGTVSFDRVSALSGKLVLYVNSFSTSIDYIKAIVTVERQSSSGAWQQYQSPYSIYGDSEVGYLSEVEYIDVASSGTYRVKVVYEDKVNGITNQSKALYTKAVSL